MATIRPNRRIERAGVNAVRTLLEEHDHLVHEIDGGADHGEDLYVSLTRNRRRTGHVIAVQVKSGRKYQRAGGYAIPVGEHFEDWRDNRIPVVGMVYDPDTGGIYWTNLTAALRRCAQPPASVPISNETVLTTATMRGFAADLEHFIDTAGLRLRSRSDGDLSQEVSTARSGATRVVDRSQEPNLIFADLAGLLLRFPRALRWSKALILGSVGPLLLAADWPHMMTFARRYASWDPSLWVSNIYLFVAILAVLVAFEYKAGRFAEKTFRLLGFVVANFLWLPFMFEGDTQERWLPGFWAGLGAILPNAGLVFLFCYYLQAEMDRHRRSRDTS